ncbi:type II toxin-antitoxin system VapC family toxin [Oscillatoria salina]|uniref:type II toxin-antitoxin system VapC family toxin n=1 Tax=Oscillatoria salina TaxID=331517 RepID=UPI001CCCF528|nr:PIN domain-containing protein [Oscillatoria salina]
MARGLIADTSGIIALLDRDDSYHELAKKAIKNKQVFVPVTILPEVDYLATKYLGERVARAFLKDVNNDNFHLLPFDLVDLGKASEIMGRYRDLPLGLVDASLLVLAERYSLTKILTLDRRHFNLIQSDRVSYLTILP